MLFIFYLADQTYSLPTLVDYHTKEEDGEKEDNEKEEEKKKKWFWSPKTRQMTEFLFVSSLLVQNAETEMLLSFSVQILTQTWASQDDTAQRLLPRTLTNFATPCSTKAAEFTRHRVTQ